jgi:hypothetical protein
MQLAAMVETQMAEMEVMQTMMAALQQLETEETVLVSA